MRVLVPLLFVLVLLYWLLVLLHFVFVVHFEEVVASVVIFFVVFSVYRLFAKGR
jgi:hypothetical protein